MRESQLGLTQLCRPSAYSPTWNAQRWRFLCGPLCVVLAAGCVKSDVELVPPALFSKVLANSNMKCAEASLGMLGTVGMIRFLPLYLCGRRGLTLETDFVEKVKVNF